jgi:hypothetical protein
VRLHHQAHPGPFCAFCGEVLGIYEPVILVRPEEPPRTISLAVEEPPDDGITMHSGCYLKSAS